MQRDALTRRLATLARAGILTGGWLQKYTVRRHDEEFACPCCGEPCWTGDTAWIAFDEHGEESYEPACSQSCLVQTLENRATYYAKGA